MTAVDVEVTLDVDLDKPVKCEGGIWFKGDGGTEKPPECNNPAKWSCTHVDCCGATITKCDRCRRELDAALEFGIYMTCSETGKHVTAVVWRVL